MNETLVHQQLFFAYVMLHVQYTTYKIIVCIEHATVLWANITHVMRGYKACKGPIHD